MRGAGAVIHSHGIETCLASMLDPGAKEFSVNISPLSKPLYFFLSSLICEAAGYLSNFHFHVKGFNSA